ncbi:hypothetical protein DB32_000846 [Sandaracinus amylolyticus]|uniref:Uncharacterized protein n=1 Tax=Sandaracinus amylolyticus TaxID=927083 RepID=A0A0F6YGH8_9BACT|nr:hypothetical protein DB32_000846 [Sandaracinus amylolyticus]
MTVIDGQWRFVEGVVVAANLVAKHAHQRCAVLICRDLEPRDLQPGARV